MGKKIVQDSIKKTYSNFEVLQLSNKVLTILERDAQSGSVYAIAVLKEIFLKEKLRNNNSSTIDLGNHPQSNRTRTTNTIQQVLNHDEVHQNIRESHR